MSVRRLSTVLWVGLLSAASTVAVADVTPTTPADPAAAPATDANGQPVEMTEDPPADMEGTSEDPDAPKVAGEQEEIKAPPKQVRSGYPLEEALRPITLPQNMSEVAIDPHAQVSPYAGTMSLRARYGITRQVQLGLTYVLAGIYDDPKTRTSTKQGIHAGRAVGLDVTVLVQDWLAIRVGVPVYIDPVATSLTIGVPLKFTFGNKAAIGGLDDLLNIRITKFAPTFYQEVENQANADKYATKTVTQKGQLRFSAYGIYNVKPTQAVFVRTSLTLEDFSASKTSAGLGLRTALRVGGQITPKKFLDLGFSLGFDDMAHAGSFGPAGYLAFRI